MTRWRGLKDLVVDAVYQGTAAVERVHQEMAVRPLVIAARVPPLAAVARRAGAVQAAVIASTYLTIRAVTRLAGLVAGLALDLVAAGKEARRSADGRSRRVTSRRARKRPTRRRSGDASKASKGG